MRHMLFVVIIGVCGIIGVFAGTTPAHAVVPTSDFSLEVSPSPLAVTVTPGNAATVELRIRNASLKPEQLKIETRPFTLSSDSQAITLGTSTPANLAQWVRYAHPTFEVGAGEWFTQHITINLPEAAGFSYPFAVVISRVQEDPLDATNGKRLEGSIAVFTLVNIDKPGATRKLELESVTTSQPIYEYLPANITVKLKNTGNSIVQPYGNLYIQRDSTAPPLSVLSLNEADSYLLPNATKDFTLTWDDGWPVHVTQNDKPHLDWGIESDSHFRFGKYTANVVAVYNDGTRDIPVSGEVSFWVIPWKLFLAALVLIVLIGFGIWSILRHIGRLLQRTQK